MLKRLLRIVIYLFVFLSLWQVFETKLSQEMLVNNQTSIEAFIPTPLSLYNTFLTDGDIIIHELSFTLTRALYGVCIGLLFALVMSILFIFYPFLRKNIYPMFFAINSFPIIGFAPLIIMIFGQGTGASIIFISSLICYFPMLVSLDTSFRYTDRDLLDFMHVLNASKLQTFLKIQVPAAIPHFFMALKLVIPSSIIGATIGEWLGTRNGVGQLITVSLYQLNPSLMYASLISVTLCCLIAVSLINIFEVKCLPWKKEFNLDVEKARH